MSTPHAAAAANAVRRPWTRVESAAVLLARDDIDTDQIIPARFLTTTQRAGLGAHCFADWRFDEHGVSRPEFALNQPSAAGRRILVAGANFGCGSSREHAPWALLDAGFDAVIAASFADIFRSNANRNGLLTVAVGHTIEALQAHVRQAPDEPISVDLERQRVAWGAGQEVSFDIDAFTKRGLLLGLDELGMLLADLPGIEAWEVAHGKAREASREPARGVAVGHEGLA